MENIQVKEFLVLASEEPVEIEVNKWLRENPVNVVEIEYTISARDGYVPDRGVLIIYMEK